MKTFLKILLIVIILGLFGYTMYFLWEKSQEKPVVFETTTAIETNIVKKTTATGSVMPRQEIEINLLYRASLMRYLWRKARNSKKAI
jgi:HlyD family secretion protein